MTHPLPPCSPDTLGETLFDNALHHGDDIGVSDERRVLTHRELYLRGHRIAASWQALGLQRSDRVAMLAMNCVEVCELYAASEISGIPLVCLNFRLAAPELQTILIDSAPTILVFEAQYADLIASIRDAIPSVRHFVAISDRPAWAEDYEYAIAAAPLAADWAPFPPEALNCLLYTSGTTGHPKGCMISHVGFRRLGELLCGMMGATASDRGLIMMPMFHMGGKSIQLGLHWAGAELHLHRAFDVDHILRTIAEKRITITHMAPTLIQSLLNHPDVGAYDLSSLRVILYSAAAMPEPVLRRGLEMLGPVFVQSYGQSEVMGTVLPARYHQLDPDPKARRRLNSIGFPPRGVRARIVDEQDVECPRGTPGEMIIQSPTAMLGYWNNSVATAETMRGGWIHTGDVGTMDEDGFIYLVDRKKDVIISGGENVYSREVENALYAHDAVEEVAVIGVPDPHWGEEVRAVVALKRDAVATAAELIAHCRTLIAGYKRPRSIVFIDELPKLGNGKIDKKDVRRLHGAPNEGI